MPFEPMFTLVLILLMIGREVRAEWEIREIKATYFQSWSALLCATAPLRPTNPVRLVGRAGTRDPRGVVDELVVSPAYPCLKARVRWDNGTVGEYKLEQLEIDGKPRYTTTPFTDGPPSDTVPDAPTMEPSDETAIAVGGVKYWPR